MPGAPNWMQMVFFLAMTLPIAFISWHAYRKQALLGISRFAAFELTILVVALNLAGPLPLPPAPLAILFWLLGAASILLAVLGLSGIFRHGKAEFVVDDTTRLIVSGAFKFVRHPLYAAVFYLGWCFFLKMPGWFTLALTCLATVFLVILARQEEKALLVQFGEDYRQYMTRVKRFIPRIF